MTGDRGVYVRSHILPRFIADKALDKAARIQFGLGGRPTLTFNSWFDSELTTRVGEDRLAKIDDLAARMFQSHGLSWRHFPVTAKATRVTVSPELEMIEIEEGDWRPLRLFLHSLLWRAAASSRFEFAEINLPTDELEHLRKIVAGEVFAEDSDFPSVLLLLTEKGRPQVHTPLAQVIDMSEPNKVAGTELPNQPIFRFFLDGLVVHMGRRSQDEGLLKGWGGRIVGQSSKLTIIGRPYEGSSQQANLDKLEAELFRDYPEQAGQIFSTLDKIE